MKILRVERLNKLKTEWLEIKEKGWFSTTRNKYLKLLEPFEVRITYKDNGKLKSDKVIIHKGFISNSASTPPIARNIISPFQCVFSAVLHDYIYNEQLYTRKDCDKIFYQGLRDMDNRGRLRSLLGEAAVRIGGSSHYGCEDKV